MRVACIYFEKNQNTQSIAEVFHRATPQIMLRGDQAIFLEISKCHHLFSERVFLRRAHATLKRLNLEARIRVAEDAATALALAVFKTNEKDDLPIEALRVYVDPLAEDLEAVKNITKTVVNLRGLGIKTLKDFKRLSPKELTTRFYSAGLVAYLRVMGQSDILWKNFVPSQTVSEKHEFDLESPVDNLEPIYFKFRPLMDFVILRLRGKGKRVKQFDLILKQEHHPFEDYRISVNLQLPYISSKAIFQIAKERLDMQAMQRPFLSRVCEFEILVTEEAPYSATQKNIFDQRREENEESFTQLVSRLATRLGSKCVFFAKTRESFLPEKNWVRVQEILKPNGGIDQFTDQLPERPLRLLTRPVQMKFLGQKIILPGLTDEIECVENKEIVYSDWWESPLERVYYKIMTKTGKNLWVYKTMEGHFLHGIFD